MSTIEALISPISDTCETPRARRGAAAVVAQYIQDLTNPPSLQAQPAAA